MRRTIKIILAVLAVLVVLGTIGRLSRIAQDVDAAAPPAGVSESDRNIFVTTLVESCRENPGTSAFTQDAVAAYCTCIATNVAAKASAADMQAGRASPALRAVTHDAVSFCTKAVLSGRR